MELSPGSFRTFVVGTTYQLGNLISSASSTIESTIGERFPLTPLKTATGTTKRYNYGLVICIFMGCVYAYVIVLTLLGPEYLGMKFGVAYDRDMVEASGEEAYRKVVGGAVGSGAGSGLGGARVGDADSSDDGMEKGHATGAERV
jgi:SHS family lactate transporter-like MFS transporter